MLQSGNFRTAWVNLLVSEKISGTRFSPIHESAEKFTDVFQQVHSAYVDTFTSESAIYESTSAVASAEGELELARLRLNAGLGTNLEVLTAQRDLTEARINKAEAIISFNYSQVQLVHDIGLASIANFTSGRMISTPQAR